MFGFTPVRITQIQLVPENPEEQPTITYEFGQVSPPSKLHARILGKVVSALDSMGETYTQKDDHSIVLPMFSHDYDSIETCIRLVASTVFGIAGMRAVTLEQNNQDSTLLQ